MVVEQLLEAVGLGGVPTPLQVSVATLGAGLGAKAGWLTLRRKTAALVAPGTYLRLTLLLAVAAGAVVVAAARGLVAGDAGIQTMYALFLANLLEQLARLALD